MKGLRIAAIGVVAVLGMLALHQLVYALMTSGRVTPLPKLGRVPEFRFTSERGLPVAARDLEGRTWIADFIFTRCGGFCPMMSERMEKLAASLRDEPRVVFVSFDVDPEHDSLADLATYSRQHRAEPERWMFLRGDRAGVRSLAGEGFKLAVVDGHADDPEPILHSSHFVLVDRNREIRGYYDGAETEGVDRLLGDARRLARD